MEIGIMGLPQTGKKLFFRLVTGCSTDPENIKAGKESGIGFSKVYDERLEKLAEIYHPKKVTPAVIKYILLPSLTKNSDDNRSAFKAISNVDALCHIVRVFEDDSVFHIEGNVDPVRDIRFAESELLLYDLVFTETRIENLEKEVKTKNKEESKKMLSLMKNILETLNKDIPLRLMDFTEDEEKMIKGYPYLTKKNMLIILNVDEKNIKSNKIIRDMEDKFSESGMYFTQVSCLIESELAELDEPEEKEMFLKDIGIERSAVEKITSMCYRALERISFFTVGEDECRAWTVRKNSSAVTAAGVIHSDIEKGFIRAEHMRVDQLILLKSEVKVKEAGGFSLKGKDYTVRDGDVLHFRFNV